MIFTTHNGKSAGGKRRRHIRAPRRVSEEHRRKELLRLAEYDELTNLYNRKKFLRETPALIALHPAERFVLFRMDINRFKLVNAYLGRREGDTLLQYIADMLRGFARTHAPCVYGRIEADIFAVCCPLVSREAIQTDIERLQTHIRAYNTVFDITAAFGLYCIGDAGVDPARMLECATLASRAVKADGVTSAFYLDEMGLAIEREQELICDIGAALDEGQFRILIQPRFELRTGTISGGEALVRWHHPRKGVISPGTFVPVFEKSGFIMRLDRVVWEQVCKKLREWIDMGYSPLPVSINVSRVNLYNPHFVEEFTALVEKYELPPRLLKIELTESAYIDSPAAMKQIAEALRKHGFQILMDDFGSGHSSLNILKDVEVDMLKIDMTVLGNTTVPGRSESIVASIVRMAKWLDLPVVAEGVETREQVDFLRTIGCDYAQGFFYAYPLEPETYITLKPSETGADEAESGDFDINTLWAGNSEIEVLFSGAPQAAGLYEYDAEKGTIDCLRVNRMFGEMFGYSDTGVDNNPLLDAVAESKTPLIEAADAAVKSKSAAECEYLRAEADGTGKWINLKFKYVNSSGDRHILFGSFFDITSYKEIELELHKFRSVIADIGKTARRMLVVDDQKINRDILHKIFASEFTVLEASGGQEALDVLNGPNGTVDVILLDMFMPGMDGEAFLKIKQDDPRLEQIPVIIVTAEDSAERQINMLAMGAYDYIVKPLIPEVIRRRVYNVMESSQRFRAMLREYQEAVNLAKADPLTRVYNRAAAEEKITDILKKDTARVHAMVMIDIDDYKDVNDTFGHSCGDLVLMEFGNKLAHYFRSGDIVARMGGDEFCVLMVGVSTDKAALNKCLELCSSIRGHAIGEEMVRISCSVGIAMSEPGMTFAQLYERSDTALYQAKNRSKGSAVLYACEEGEE